MIVSSRELRHLYEAIGEPGLIEGFDTDRMRLLEAVSRSRIRIGRRWTATVNRVPEHLVRVPPGGAVTR